jgi:hypothetical protein
MKAFRSWTVALALSTPAIAFAQSAEQPDQQQQMPSDQQQMPPDQQQQGQMPQGQQQGQMQQGQMSEQAQLISSHVVPTIAGIESADTAAAALYNMAGSGQKLDRKAVENTVQLAQQGIQIAMTRVQSLQKVKGLSQEDKDQANNVVQSLKQARTTVQQLQKKAGTAKDPNAMEQIRQQTMELHNNLDQAQNAVEQIAKTHQVPTELEFEG